jgi:hypothetical protein
VILSIFFAATVAASASALPAGHPHLTPQPHAAPNFFRPPADTTSELATIPTGTIRVEVRDPFDHPLANHTVDLGIVRQSIAKGDTHLHDQTTTDTAGDATFAGLETGSNIAYRVTVHEADATYAATPFRLDPTKGSQVVLHVYPVMHDLPQSNAIGARSIIAVEVKDDRIQIQQEFDFFNGTALAWVPHDVIFRLPDGFTALNGMQQMSDLGVDAVPGQGARLHGTFPPGQSTVVFSWQLPYAGDPSVSFDVGLPPAVRDAFVQAAAAPNMKLEVAGFREAIVRSNEEGLRLLVTRKQLNDNEPAIRKISIGLSGLPTPGPTRLIATVLAVLGLAAGIYIATQRKTARTRTKASAKRDRERILEEIDELETAKARGDIGPKTYERARRELVDDLAAVLATAK